jgi:hypothetical protein
MTSNMARARDGDLRAIFRAHFPDWHWTAIESYCSPGTPDDEFCTSDGRSGWVELKSIAAWAVDLRPLQVIWIEKRVKHNGLVSIAVRRRPTAQEFRGRDELWFVAGRYARLLANAGLKAAPSVLLGIAGPSSWDWAQLEGLLTGAEQPALEAVHRCSLSSPLSNR